MEKKRLFVDMDGTLARFHDEADYLERMFEKGFFRDLTPFENMVEGIRLFLQRYPDVEVFTMTAKVPSEFCEPEKNDWTDEHIPEIDYDHRIYTEMGKSKAEYVPGGITKNDYLLDDYNKGLNLWLYDGGSAIKCHNNINQRGLGAYGGSAGQLWVGSMVHTDDAPEMIVAELAQHMGLAYDLNKVVAKKEEISGQPDRTTHLRKVTKDKAAPVLYEATYLSNNVSRQVSETFTNPLNAIRWLEGKSGYNEIPMECTDGTRLYIPQFQATALASNLYGCSVSDLLDNPEDISDVADAFRLAIERADLPMVGQVHYLGFNGEVGETAIFRTVKEMNDEVEDCRDCGCPIMVDWFVQPKRYRQIELYCSPDLGAPEVFTISENNLRMAAQLCGFSIGNVDDFLSEYTWDNSADIWKEYAQYIQKIAEIMKGFATREEVEEEFYSNVTGCLDFPVEAAIFMLENIENWARWQNDEAFAAGVMDKAMALAAELKGNFSEDRIKPSLDGMISSAQEKLAANNPNEKEASPDR